MDLTIKEYIQKVAASFDTCGNPVSAKAYGSGHINGTFLITTDTGARYTLQSINANVFKNPSKVMDNILLVLDHIKHKLEDVGGDVDRECLTPIKVKNGGYLYSPNNSEFYRMYAFIDGNVYDKVEKPEHFYCAAKAFGKFQNLLSDFPADKLFETIKNFHDTKGRFENLEAAIKADSCARLEGVRSEVEFALSRKKDAGIIIDAVRSGEIPLRVTHNDTKFNNVLLDDSGNGFCVIDLDTVMPGSLLYDFGDAIRFGATHAAEDEQNLDIVDFDIELFEAYTKGFLEALGDRITEKEVSLLALSAKIMTLECGIRFLTDYLEGDVYFKTSFPQQNLYRARTQLKLVYEMEKRMPEMERIVYKYIG